MEEVKEEEEEAGCTQAQRSTPPHRWGGSSGEGVSLCIVVMAHGVRVCCGVFEKQPETNVCCQFGSLQAKTVRIVAPSAGGWWRW